MIKNEDKFVKDILVSYCLDLLYVNMCKSATLTIAKLYEEAEVLDKFCMYLIHSLNTDMNVSTDEIEIYLDMRREEDAKQNKLIIVHN